jgi:hypothetical protein
MQMDMRSELHAPVALRGCTAVAKIGTFIRTGNRTAEPAVVSNRYLEAVTGLPPFRKLLHCHKTTRRNSPQDNTNSLKPQLNCTITASRTKHAYCILAGKPCANEPFTVASS